MQNILIGLVIGVLIGGPTAFYIVDHLEGHIETVFLVLVGLTIVIGLILAVGALLAPRILKLLFGRSAASLNNIAAATSEAATHFQKNDNAAALQSMATALQEGAAWYSAISLRRWLISTATAVALMFAGALGSVLLYRQNLLLSTQNGYIRDQISLLDTQNSKIDIQSLLIDNQRRANLVFELSDIMQIVNDEYTRWNTLAESERPDSLSGFGCVAPGETREQKRFELSPLTISRIVSLTRTLKPYYQLLTQKKDGKLRSTLSEDLLSPERAQILTLLIDSDAQLDQIMRAADFSYADMSEAILSGATLCDIRGTSMNFEKAVISRSELRSSVITNSSFRDSEISESSISEFFLAQNDFTGATIRDSHVCPAIGPRYSTRRPPQGKLDNTNLDSIEPCEADDAHELVDYLNGMISDPRKQFVLEFMDDITCRNEECRITVYKYMERPLRPLYKLFEDGLCSEYNECK